jgi:hypothetical protein
MKIVYKGYSVGDKIKFKGERQRYTVKAKSNNGRFMICTKPFNIIHHVLYTIVDFKEKIRGKNNLVFNCYDYSDQKEIDECMKDLISGNIKISYRHRIPLKIDDLK